MMHCKMNKGNGSGNTIDKGTDVQAKINREIKVIVQILMSRGGENLTMYNLLVTVC